MPGIAIIGAQWGDEGKGKVVDFITEKADYVVRFHGGSNAGHTIVINGKKTKLSLIPSGILRPGVRCVVAAGVVLNPNTFSDEVTALAAAGTAVTQDNLALDFRTNLVLDYHIEIDKARELLRGDAKIGTTGRGIGPCYEDRAARIGVSLGELADLSTLKTRLTGIVAEKNAYLKYVLKSDVQVSLDRIIDTLSNFRDKFHSLVTDCSIELHRANLKGATIVYEGAQATLLDQLFGTVPFVTSSHTIAGAITTGCGISPKAINTIIGISKAYCTRVGSGPFPTELFGDEAEKIRTVGAEFGTVTGRPRRCGWLDVAALKTATRFNGFDSLVITKLDVLSGLKTIKLGVGYQGKNEIIPEFCSSMSELPAIYEELPGWSEDISTVRKIQDLPSAALKYLDRIQTLTGLPISHVSVSPEREGTLVY